MGKKWRNDKRYDSRDVVTISGTIWNDNTRTVAEATNINAQILKQVIDRLDLIETWCVSKAREDE